MKLYSRSWRLWLAAAGLAAVVSGCGLLRAMVGTAHEAAVPEPVVCNLTAPNAEGPYYVPGAPFTDKVAPDGLPGERLIISGTVYAADCMTPLAGAVLDVWQADASGQYDFSDQYILRGRVTADANGHYRFETIMPAQYGQRPAHIHFKISHPDAQPLTTQLYFEGDPNNATDSLIDPSLIIALTTENTPDGTVLHGLFDIVLAGR